MKYCVNKGTYSGETKSVKCMNEEILAWRICYKSTLDRSEELVVPDHPHEGFMAEVSGTILHITNLPINVFGQNKSTIPYLTKPNSTMSTSSTLS